MLRIAKIPVAVNLIFQMGLLISPVQASDLDGLSDASFGRLSSQLDDIELREGAESAAAEIAIARQWIENGRLLLREGSVRKAATIAERLPSQLELVRVLVTAGAALIKAEGVGQEIYQMKSKLVRLKARYNRLMLQKNGARVSNAFPPMEDKAQ
ncbi:MAG: hypothetical protein GY847_03730 [Proteobacteria bacterium]|nr:hypothetical protein [Pseudomonadota bacterium]